MKVWVVYLDGEAEYASVDWYDAHDRYLQLIWGFGKNRVEMRLEER